MPSSSSSSFVSFLLGGLGLLGVFQGPVSAAAQPAATNATLVLLPWANATHGAVCLDNSPPGVYVRDNGVAGTPWILAWDGGGFCFNESDCYERSLTPLGSSLNWPSTRVGLGIESDDCSLNPAFCAFNVALFPYCDGFSQLGSRSDAIVFAPNASFSASVWARGYNILHATLDYLFANTSLATAPAVLLDGCSAGGLSALHHVDVVASLASPGVDVRAVADAGFFADLATVTGDFYYRSLLTYYFQMHNGSAGVKGACLASRPAADAWQCATSALAVAGAEHAVFLIESDFDSYQLGNVFAPVWLPGVDPSWGACAGNASACSAQQANDLLYSWMAPFRGALAFAGALGPPPRPPPSNGPNGLFLHSCFSHCQWGQMHQYAIAGQTMYEAFVTWYNYSLPEGKAATYQWIDCQGILCNPSCGAAR